MSASNQDDIARSSRDRRAFRDSLEVGQKVSGVVVGRPQSHGAVFVDIGVEEPAYMEIIWMNDKDKECPVGSRIEATIRSMDRRIIRLQQFPFEEFLEAAIAKELSEQERQRISKPKWWQFWRSGRD